MFNLRNKLVEAKEQLAFSIIQENGKPLEAARIEVKQGIKMVEYCCNIDGLIMG